MNMISFLSVCSVCTREQVMPSPTMPDGWVKSASGDEIPAAICPDCAEPPLTFEADRARLRAAIESQQHFHSLFVPIDQTNFTIGPWTRPVFDIHLERQPDGSYRIAAVPGVVLMRNAPLTFYMTSAEARAFAADLIRHADLADHPGAMGTPA